jgi:hypothetical protein
MPQANAFFCVLTRTASNSVKVVVLTKMYVNLLLHELNETMYLVTNVLKVFFLPLLIITCE